MKNIILTTLLMFLIRMLGNFSSSCQTCFFNIPFKVKSELVRGKTTFILPVWGYFGPSSAKQSSVSLMPTFLKSGIVVMLISGFGMHGDIFKYIYLGNTPKIQGI